MDLELLNRIKQKVLDIPLAPKEESNDFLGVCLHSNSPFKKEDYEAPIKSFKLYSDFDYPVVLYLSDDSLTRDVDYIAKKYKNVSIESIPRLSSIFEFNLFSIYNLPFLIQADRCVYFQNDGFLLKKGWEEKTFGYSWLGAKWKYPIKVTENVFNFGPVQVGNGGCNFRRTSKCKQVLDFVRSHTSDRDFIKGIKINNKTVNVGSFLAEDLFFCYFGFGSGIFEPVDLNFVDSFAKEPILFKDAISDNPSCHFFHRVDE